MGGVEVGVEDAPRQLAADQDRLHGFPHGLLGAQGQVKAALGAALPKGDVVFDVNGDGHQAEEEEEGQEVNPRNIFLKPNREENY